MNRTTIAALAAVLIAGGGTVGCAGSGATDTKATPAPEPAATGFTAADCKQLLELNLEADAASDVSNEPRCVDLTHNQYVKLVGEVLAEHRDEILARAADKATYDDAWDSLTAKNQVYTCGLLREEGSETVGTLLGALMNDPSLDTKAMAKYFFMEKC